MRSLLFHALARSLRFAPLAGLEVLGTRVENTMLVVEVNLTNNMSSQTIDRARLLIRPGGTSRHPVTRPALTRVRAVWVFPATLGQQP